MVAYWQNCKKACPQKKNNNNKWAKIESKHKIKAFCHLFYEKTFFFPVYKTFQLHQMLASTTASNSTSQTSGPYRNKQA